MSDPKILFQNDFIEVIENNDRVGIKQKTVINKLIKESNYVKQMI